MDNGFLPICSEPKLTERNRQTVEKEAGRDSGPFRYQRFVCALWGDRQTDRQTDRQRQRQRDRQREMGKGRERGRERASEQARDRQSDKIILYYTRGEREGGGGLFRSVFVFIFLLPLLPPPPSHSPPHLTQPFLFVFR